MRKYIKIFIVLVAKLSLIIYPPKLAFWCNFIKNYFLSTRFYLQTKTKNQCLLTHPFYMCGEKYMEIGKNLNSGPDLRMECVRGQSKLGSNPILKIGDNVSISYRCHIGVIDKIVIGNDVLLGSNVLITDHSHGNTDIDSLKEHPTLRKLFSKGPVIIEDDVWIGENSVILPNVIIGHNSIIGANTVVTDSVPSFSICVGNPMRIIKAKQK